MTTPDPETLLDRAGHLKATGEPFSRPILMAAFIEEDPEKKALLYMAYRFYHAYDHYRGDKMIELAGYHNTKLYTATGPPTDTINTAKTCIENIAPGAPTPTPTEQTTTPLPTTPTGATRTWRISYSIARAASTLASNGMEKFAELIAEISKDIIIGHTNPAKDRITAICRLISEAMTGELIKEKILENLDTILEAYNTEKNDIYKALKEIKNTIEKLEYDTIIQLQPTLMHLADTLQLETLDHPKNNDYILGPYKRTPTITSTDPNPPPKDPDRLEQYIEEIKAAYNIQDIPHPLTGAHGLEHSKYGATPDLAHWLISRYRTHNTPAAAVITHNKTLKIGVRYWADTNTSYTAWIYPKTEVTEPNHRTPHAIDPLNHEKAIIEAPELPL